MNIRYPVFVGLLLALLPIAPVAADTPAVAVVRQYLAARAAGNYFKINQLLTKDSQRTFQEVNSELAAGKSASELFEGVDSNSLMAAVNLFFVDIKNTSGYRFQIIGPAPGDASTVLVRALPFGASAQTPFLLKIVTTQAPAVRMDILASLVRTSPKPFEAAREQARRAVSNSNLKQLSLGIFQYEQDHDGHFPDADQWVDEIMPYVKDASVFHDPSAPAGEKWSYAFNRNLSGAKMADLSDPSMTVMLFESTAGTQNASDTGETVPRPGRHLGGTDYARADGHVQWFADGTKLSYQLSGK